MFADRRPRTLLRAELREAGYDAIGASSAASALRYPPTDEHRGPVRLLILDDDTAGAMPLEQARARYPESRFLLIQRAAGGPRSGPWDRVLRRPITIGEIVTGVRELVPLPSELEKPIDG